MKIVYRTKIKNSFDISVPCHRYRIGTYSCPGRAMPNSVRRTNNSNNRDEQQQQHRTLNNLFHDDDKKLWTDFFDRCLSNSHTERRQVGVYSIVNSRSRSKTTSYSFFFFPFASFSNVKIKTPKLTAANILLF